MPLPTDLLLTLAAFGALGYACSEPDAEAESQEYGAHTFEVDGHKTGFRIARATLKKAGQFVTLWQRTAEGGGPIRPFDSSDGIGLFVVSVRGEAGFGQFNFPQAALIAHDVVSEEFVGGNVPSGSIRRGPNRATAQRRPPNAGSWSTFCRESVPFLRR